MTTPRDSFCLFAWNYSELANSLRTLNVTGLKVVSNPGPFDQGSSDLTTRLDSRHSGSPFPIFKAGSPF